MTQCPLCTMVDPAASALRVATLDECVVVLGENQGCTGWCVCVLKEHVEHLDQLPIPRQARVFAEVAAAARAIRTVFPHSGPGGRPPRINYECLGNQVAHVHWHVIPRHADDPSPGAPVWGWGPEKLRGDLGERERGELAARLRTALVNPLATGPRSPHDSAC